MFIAVENYLFKLMIAIYTLNSLYLYLILYNIIFIYTLFMLNSVYIFEKIYFYPLFSHYLYIKLHKSKLFFLI